MKKNILLTAAFAISLALNAYLLINHRDSTKKTVRLEGDSRIEVALKPEHREFVLKEMRQFVNGLNMINRGIAENKPKLIIKAGQQSGSEVNPPIGLVMSVPVNFLKMGRPTHKMFDEIADSARINYNPKTTQRQLVELTNRCVACHATYRFGTK